VRLVRNIFTNSQTGIFPTLVIVVHINPEVQIPKRLGSGHSLLQQKALMAQLASRLMSGFVNSIVTGDGKPLLDFKICSVPDLSSTSLWLECQLLQQNFPLLVF
jgi:hypothetical protein